MQTSSTLGCPLLLWLLVQQSGTQALPIVVLISLLVGLILAFATAVLWPSSPL